MDDTDPVNKILIQATEYLGKLGRNLNSRSERIKEKKLSNERLTNTLAVKKASQKILEICELSKKSIDNVEIGVKKLLEKCEQSSKKEINNDDSNKFVIHKYCGSSVKVPKNIVYKHYRSVRVRATSWPRYMLDRYPVYLNCKEYRRRIRLGESSEENCKDLVHTSNEDKQVEANILSKQSLLESDDERRDKEKELPNDDVESVITLVKKKRLQIRSSSSSNSIRNIDQDSLNNSNVNVEHKLKENTTGKKNEFSKTEKVSDSPKENQIFFDKPEKTARKRKRSLSSSNSNKSSIEHSRATDNIKIAENQLEQGKENSKNDEMIITKNTDNIDVASVEKERIRGVASKTTENEFDKKNILVSEIRKFEEAEDIIVSNEENHQKNQNTSVEVDLKETNNKSDEKNCLSDIESEQHNSNSEITKSNSETETNKHGETSCVAQTTTAPEDDTNHKVGHAKDDEETQVECCENKLQSDHSKQNDNDDVHKNCEHCIDIHVETKATNDCPSNAVEIPKIKCIDINKLLSKPIESENPLLDKSHKFNKHCNLQKDKKAASHMKQRVEDFKPKMFSIKVEKLPEINKVFLTKLKLNRITDQNGRSLVEVDNFVAKNELLNESSDTSEVTPSPKSNSSKSKERMKKTRESIKAKRMLLNQSSSESEDELVKEALYEIRGEIAAMKSKSCIKQSNENDKHRKRLLKSSTSSSDEEEHVEKLLNELKRKKEEKKEGSIDQFDENNDEGSVDSEMARSKSKRPTAVKSNNSDTKNNSEPTSDKEETNINDPQSEHSAEDENNVDDLPDITLLNGDPDIGELAKNDLLNDSEASERTSVKSQKTNGSSVATAKNSKKTNDSDEDIGEVSRKRSKRLRGKTFTSDSSEEGTSKMSKQTKVKSDSDSSSDLFKTNKRKTVKSTDSDDSTKSSSTDAKGKKKRRRIKKMDSDESENSDDSDKEDGKNKSGRKNIRRVMGKDRLEDSTIRAAKEERERVARINERQKLYNNVAFDESGKPDEKIIDKVVLDYDPNTKEPLIEVDSGLVKKLKPHQANGVKFMWDACFESVKQIKKGRGSGCILAHCMGLGKTLQVVSLTHTLLANTELTGVERVLVVCPLSTVLNWVNEFRMWTEYAENQFDLNIYELSRFKQNSERAYQLQDWLENGGVCVLGYEMFRNLSADNTKKFRKKMLKQFQESLVDPGPDLVVCDEGHLLKNEKTSLSISMNRIKTRRRIVLTGTPLQNNLKEYYCMVQFVKPNLLGKYNEYLNRFVNPITNGQYVNSTDYDIKIMKRRSHVLHKMLEGSVQRRDYAVLAPFLPPKHEYVLFITLTDLQIKLYQHYLDNYSRRQHPERKSSGFLFPDFQALQRIWTHPFVMKANSDRYEIMQQKKRDREEDSEGSLVDFIDDDSTPDETTTEESSEELSDLSDDSNYKSKKNKNKPKKKKSKDPIPLKRKTRNTAVSSEEDVKEVPLEPERPDNPTEWWKELVAEDQLEDMRNSYKLMLLFEILRQCEAIGDKVLVFSQSLFSLDLIEYFLNKIDEATQAGKTDETLGGHLGMWSPGLDYFRLDGSTSCENRSIWCKNFNREDNPRARLFLISTRAGGLGINLVAANRVIIFDVSWNPSHDVQSIFRVYRFGQKKPCYIYRFIAMGTMEEKIYERQVTKQAISKRVIDEQQIDRHYAETDLQELYNFTPKPEQPRPTPVVPKDRLFADIIKAQGEVIYKFHEHDSLLENKEEETLSEEERKAAWDDYENEKNKPVIVPQANLNFYNGFGNMMASQQQMAMATIAAMLRKDYPALSEQQIANMLPTLLYQADQTMLQKMNSMMTAASGFKLPHHPQGMLNPMMAAGLQYNPVWQQQQQMQLQRLQQQGFNQNVKYYSGGLGSRDPVSMAIQQQRQRDILVRPPPRETGEVVNLDDSD